MVTVSSLLLFLVAAVFLVGLVVSFAYVGTISDVYEEAYAGTDLEGTEGVVVGATIGFAVFFTLLAAVLVLLAIFNNLGKNGSRIATWVIGGIALCCSGLGLLFQGAGSIETDTSSGGPSQEEVNAMLDDALPAWYSAYGWVTGIIAVLALIVALVLLMLPAAHPFFRKEPQQDVFEPPPA